MFSHDYGDYPSSTPEPYPGETGSYSVQGSHRLALAMFGRDRQGCPRSGQADSVYGKYYTPDGTSATPDVGTSNWGTTDAFRTPRRMPYIDPNGFYLCKDNSKSFFAYMWLICDRFSRRKSDEITLGESYAGRNVILYYKARPSGDNAWEIYNVAHNNLIQGITDWTTPNYRKDPFYWGTRGSADNGAVADGGIINASAQVGFIFPPHNKETFLLISAGYDGLFFTEDDIGNWNKK